jgi:hypothetical protein
MAVAAIFNIRNVVNSNIAIGMVAVPSFLFATVTFFPRVNHRGIRQPE